MKEVASRYIVILLVVFSVLVVVVQAYVNDEELAAAIDALTAAEARAGVNANLVDSLTDEDERTNVDEDTCTVKNVAVNKPAKASSAYSPKSVARLAVDGNLDQNYSGRSCFSTRDRPHANKWWYVDLQQIYIIESVKFYNRMDCCPERATDFKILVGDTLDEMTEVGFVETMGSTKTVTMPPNTRGRFVKLVQEKKAVFHMCEVEVYALPEYCSNPCKNGGVLTGDVSDGYKCVCPAYKDYRFLGDNCEEIWIKLPSNPTYNLVSSLDRNIED